MNKPIFLIFAFIISVFNVSAQHQISVNNQSELGKLCKHENNIPKDLIMITHSSTQNILSGNSASCNTDGIHSENGYWRVFDLGKAPFNITSELVITSADVGVESISGISRTQQVIVKLYTLTGGFSLANLTEIYSEEFSIESDADGTIVNMPFTTPVTVPVGTKLVYELLTPDGQAWENSFFIGSNTDAQTGPSYISAPDCGITEPIATGDIGYGRMHSVLNLWGEAVTGVDEPRNKGMVYPNPTDGIFYIRVDRIMKLQIFDVTGKLIRTQMVNGTSVLEMYDPGLYFITFSDALGSITQRIIVK
jgi:hypothetical protein